MKYSITENALFWMFLILSCIGGSFLYKHDPIPTPCDSILAGQIAYTYHSSEQPNLSLFFHMKEESDRLYPLLNSLSKHHIKATFFVTDTWEKSHSELIKIISREGHEILRLK